MNSNRQTMLLRAWTLIASGVILVVGFAALGVWGFGAWEQPVLNWLFLIMLVLYAVMYLIAVAIVIYRYMPDDTTGSPVQSTAVLQEITHIHSQFIIR